MSPEFSTAETRPLEWLASLETRYASQFTRPELLKAIRALSARYVESRSQLHVRSPLDSAGKRSAFAIFYAPLHFFTAREVMRRVGADQAPIDSVLDLGCGTGAASAAWALTHPAQPPIQGVDRHPWAMAEAPWTWRTLGLAGRARRGDIVATLEQILAHRLGRARTKPGLLLAWSLNELDDAALDRARTALLALTSAGHPLLILEPLARGAAPWWESWCRAFGDRGRADEWKLDVPLPPTLAALNDAAGFRERQLSARSLWVAAG